MKIKPLKYELSESAMKSVDKQTDIKAEFDLSKQKKAKKGNTFLMVNKDTSTATYIVPIFHQNNFFAGEIPKPSTLFLAQAVENEKRVSEILKTFPNRVHMHLHQGPNSKTEIKLVNNSDYHLFLMYKVGSITALISAMECFLNEIIPDKFTIENTKKEIVGKKEIERKWDLKSKLKIIVPKIKQIENEREFELKTNSFLQLNKLRNEFTHLKTKLEDNFGDPFIKYFEELINMDLKEKINQINSLIKLIEPNYFEYIR